jgi:hypothetical protein
VRLAKVTAADPGCPSFGPGQIIGIGCTSHLEEEGIETSIGRMMDDIINLGRISRISPGRPVEAGDPHASEFRLARPFYDRHESSTIGSDLGVNQLKEDQNHDHGHSSGRNEYYQANALHRMLLWHKLNPEQIG